MPFLDIGHETKFKVRRKKIIPPPLALESFLIIFSHPVIIILGVISSLAIKQI